MCEAPRGNLPWEIAFTMMCVAAPIINSATFNFITGKMKGNSVTVNFWELGYYINSVKIPETRKLLQISFIPQFEGDHIEWLELTVCVASWHGVKIIKSHKESNQIMGKPL